jgi:hypothetical protein
MTGTYNALFLLESLNRRPLGRAMLSDSQLLIKDLVP